MFEPYDNMISEFGSVPVRRRGGAWTMMRVARLAYRRTMVSFAKYVLIQFDILVDGDLVERVVDEWLNKSPSL